MGGHRADAEDAVGGAFIKLLSSDAELGEIHDVDAWLSRVARNACLDTYRARKRRNEQTLEWDDRSYPPYLEQALVHDAGPESRLLQREAAKVALRLIQSLPEDLRIPLLRRIEDGMSYRDIAARLALTEDNMRKRVQTARMALARGMERYLSGAEAAGGARGTLPREGPSELEHPAIPTSEALYPIVVTGASGSRCRVWLALDSPLTTFTPDRYRRYARYVHEHPSGWKVRLKLADMLLRAGRLDEAAEQYRVVLSCRPHVWRARWRLVLCLQTAARDEEAARVLVDMQDEPAAKPATREHLRALLELTLGRRDAAELAFQRAAALDPGNGAHWTALGSLLGAAARPVEAWSALCRALAASPRDVQALVQAHDVAQLLGQTREQEDTLARAFAAHGQCAAVLVRVIEHRCQIGQIGRDTAALIRSLLRSWPDLGEAHGCVAQWCRACGRREKALNTMRVFVEAHPRDTTGWLLLAREARAAGELQEAEEAARKALLLEPDGHFLPGSGAASCRAGLE